MSQAKSAEKVVQDIRRKTRRQFSADRRPPALLEAQKARADRLTRACGRIVPWVFFREVARGRGGPKHPKPITSFTKAWKAAVAAAGCPGRIPHDLRRTAVRNMVRRGVPTGLRWS